MAGIRNTKGGCKAKQNKAKTKPPTHPSSAYPSSAYAYANGISSSAKTKRKDKKTHLLFGSSVGLLGRRAFVNTLILSAAVVIKVASGGSAGRVVALVHGGQALSLLLGGVLGMTRGHVISHGRGMLRRIMGCTIELLIFRFEILTKEETSEQIHSESGRR